MMAFLEGLKALGTARLAAMAAVALGMLAMLALLTLHGSTPPHMSLLYGDLDVHEASEIADILEKAHIQHELGGQEDRIMVPADQVANARLLLAKNNLPSGGSIGYEIFDRGDSLTATQFEQTINQTRALEGELTRSIRLIRGVKAARVHLVMPHREPFATEQQAAQASVLLSMAGTSRLDAQGVQAVVNLVAAAVPGLKPQNIGVIDTGGNVLARAGQPTGTLAAAQSVDELRRATELRLSHAVEEMLEPTLGIEHVHAETSVTMNADVIRETQETYNPDQQVLRSQQTTSDKSRNTEADPNTSVQNNLPNANASLSQAGSQDDKQEEVNNYEIGKTVRTVVQDQPRIARISIAVMVDGTLAPDATGKLLWKPRTQDDLDRIASLVKSAIGFDQKRGDNVSVVSMQFTLPALDDGHSTPSGLFGLHLTNADAMHLGQNGVVAIFVLLVLLLVVRPMVVRLTSSTTSVAYPGESLSSTGIGSLSSEAIQRAAISGQSGTGRALALAGPNADGEQADDGMISIANIDGRISASSIRQIVDLVAKHPEESLSILRGWLGHEREAS